MIRVVCWLNDGLKRERERERERKREREIWISENKLENSEK
jgi:hypothetical protein